MPCIWRTVIGKRGIVSEIRLRAQTLGVPVKLHSREELARISKNGKQDQGVAVDVMCPSFRSLEDYLAGTNSRSHGDYWHWTVSTIRKTWA